MPRHHLQWLHNNCSIALDRRRAACYDGNIANRRIQMNDLTIFNAILARITNPQLDLRQRHRLAARETAALDLVATKHHITPVEAWAIIERIDDDPATPMSEPTWKMNNSERIYWDWVAECDLM